MDITAIPSVVPIIQDFKDAMYDDIGVSRHVFSDAMRALSLSDRTTGLTAGNYKEHMRASMLRDLKILQEEIPKHLEGEFCIMPEDVGYRLGHFNSIRYILATGFWDSDPGGPYNKPEQLPMWYYRCATMINEVPSYTSGENTIVSYELVPEMIEIMAGYQPVYTVESFKPQRAVN